MSVREEIAAALNVVDGIEVYPTYQQVSGDGQGYVQWLRTEYPNVHGGEDYWGVLINVPQDLAAAQEWIEENRSAIVAALMASRTLIVTRASPQVIPVPDNQSNRALVIEGHRETEE